MNEFRFFRFSDYQNVPMMTASSSSHMVISSRSARGKALESLTTVLRFLTGDCNAGASSSSLVSLFFERVCFDGESGGELDMVRSQGLG